MKDKNEIINQTCEEDFESVFVIDAGGTEASDFIIFEIQSLESSNNIVRVRRSLNMNILLRDRLYRYQEGEKTVKVDLHPYFESKVNQRALLQSNPNTKKYIPRFLIIARADKINEKSIENEKLKNFYEENNGKIVIKKGNASEGKGNIFKNYQNFEDFLETLNKVIEEGVPFLIEAINFPINKKNYANGFFQTGTFSRHLIMYRKKEKKIKLFPMTKLILDITNTTDSHNKCSRLKNKEHFTVSEDFSRKDIKKSSLKLQKVFQNIAEVVTQGMSSLPKNEQELQIFFEREVDETIFLSKKDIACWREYVAKFYGEYLREKKLLPKYSLYTQSHDQLIKNAFIYVENENDPIFERNIKHLIKNYPENYFPLRNTMAILYYMNHQIEDLEVKALNKKKIDDFYCTLKIRSENYFDLITSFAGSFSKANYALIPYREWEYNFPDENESVDGCFREALKPLAYQVYEELLKILCHEVPCDKEKILFLKNLENSIKRALKKTIFIDVKINLFLLMKDFHKMESYPHLLSLILCLPNLDSAFFTLRHLDQLCMYSKNLNDQQFDNFLNTIYNFKDLITQISPDHFKKIYDELQEPQRPVFIKKSRDFISGLPFFQKYIASEAQSDTNDRACQMKH